MNTCVKLTLVLSLVMPLASGCSNAQTPSPQPQAASPSQSQNAPEFSQAQLDSLLAPIALYPDTVLSHVLIASTYPLEVVQADRWARSNKKLTGDEAVQAVEDQDWDPSVKALVAFPDVLRRMSDDLEWTQQLGDAFLADESRVMDSIQNLRSKAYASGNLNKVEHVKVVRDEQIITIEPAVERVVYVPVYDTRVVYGNWWWANYPPVYWNHPASYTYVSGFYWGPSVYIGSHFFFSGCHWSDRRVVVMDHHHHHHHSHHFYNNRSIVHYRDSRHWHHNPTHRRGVAYHDNRTRERFHSPRESYQDSRSYRNNLNSRSNLNSHNNLNSRDNLRARDGHASNSRITPNQARDQRQGNQNQANRAGTGSIRDPQAHGSQAQGNREARVIGGGRIENGRTQTQSADRTQYTTDRAHQLRARLGNTTHESRPNVSNQGTAERGGERNNRFNTPTDRTNSQVDRAASTPRQQSYRGYNPPTPRAAPTPEGQAIERTNPNQARARVERTHEQPRQEEARQEEVRPTQERMERSPRDDSRSQSRSTTEYRDSGRSGGGNRESFRGGRER